MDTAAKTSAANMKNLFTMMWPSQGLGETIAVGERSYVTGLLNFEDLHFFTMREGECVASPARR
jgi:hypothetical protein